LTLVSKIKSILI